MLKRWFEFSANGDGAACAGEPRNGLADGTSALMGSPASESPGRISAGNGKHGTGPSVDRSNFDDIYRATGAKVPQMPNGIMKVVDMVNSQHLSGLSADARRCAILMALEVTGAQVEDLLQDAMARQRALDDYEKQQQDKLRKFEAAKEDENRNLHSELDRLTNQYMARLQANLDEVAKEQDEFRAWQKKKQREAQRMAEAAAFCVPEGAGLHGGSLSAVLERACATRG